MWRYDSTRRAAIRSVRLPRTPRSSSGPASSSASSTSPSPTPTASAPSKTTSPSATRWPASPAPWSPATATPTPSADTPAPPPGSRRSIRCSSPPSSRSPASTRRSPPGFSSPSTASSPPPPRSASTKSPPAATTAGRALVRVDLGPLSRRHAVRHALGVGDLALHLPLRRRARPRPAHARYRRSRAEPRTPQTTRRWLLFGLLWALIALSNSTLLLFLPVCGIWILTRLAGAPPSRCKAEQNPVRHLTRATLAGVLFLACIAPWIYRNWSAFHAFIPMRSNLGAELYAGNGPGAYGFRYGVAHRPARAGHQHRLYVRSARLAYVRQRGQLAKAWIRAASRPLRHPLAQTLLLLLGQRPPSLGQALVPRLRPPGQLLPALHHRTPWPRALPPAAASPPPASSPGHLCFSRLRITSSPSKPASATPSNRSSSSSPSISSNPQRHTLAKNIVVILSGV